MPLLLRLRDLLFRLLTPFAIVVFLIEDLLIRRLGRQLGRLAGWPPIARAEAWAARLPPYGALALFLLPSTLIVPEKLFVIWLLHSHQYWLAIGVLIGAKLFATAVVGRILSICHPTLSQLGWFRRADDWVRLTRNRIHGAIRNTRLWQTSERLKKRIADWAPFAQRRSKATRAP
ncbi:MAG: conserved rane protein of unknown function [Rhodospirillales bacterium]|nr:conserved rane protein of unknown function [Rhodospirillales bacterium]